MALPRRTRLVSLGQARAPAGTEVLSAPAKPQQTSLPPAKSVHTWSAHLFRTEYLGLVGGCDCQLGRLCGSGALCFSVSHCFPSVNAASAKVLRAEAALSTQAASHKSFTEEEAERRPLGKKVVDLESEGRGYDNQV